MASPSFLFFSSTLCFLAFFVLSFSLHVNGGQTAESRVTVTVESLLPATVCSSSKAINHTGMKVVHRHGPCSPAAGNSRAPTHNQILSADQSRVDSLHRRYSTTAAAQHRGKQKGRPAAAASEIPATRGTALGSANYVVTVGFGTPKKDMSIFFDTGSDVTWIQCQPCVSYCYSQQDPIFDPSQSHTYLNISCSSAYCSQLDTSGCSGTTCVYGVQYGDNSYTVGFFASDTLTLSYSDQLPNFRFGCGEKNRGLFGKAAGLLGLGRNPVSIVSQSSQKYGGVFSYCLPSSSSSTGYLQFGGTPANNVKYTAMLSDSSMPTFYFLDLIGISVAGRPLSISQTVFSTAGTILDSGTVISRLPPAAYSALRTAFRQGMTQYPTAAAAAILDTCYDLSNYSTVSIPTVALLFRGGLSVNLEISGILYIVQTSQVCLAFAGNSVATDVGIIGNTQQQKFGVVYDIPRKLVGFAAGGCS